MKKNEIIKQKKRTTNENLNKSMADQYMSIN